MISYLILEESSSDDESEAPQVSTGISILTLDKLALDNVYLNYLRKKAKDAEETPEDSPPEVRKPKKRPKFKKSKSQKDFLQNNISSISRQGSGRSSNLSREGSSRSSNLSVPKVGEGSSTPRMTLRRASLQPMTLNKFQLNRSQKKQGRSSEHLKKAKMLQPEGSLDSVNEDKKEEKEEIENKVENDEKEESKKLTGRALLLSLMKENVGEKDLTPEQKALHESYHTLLNEYKRRKQLRQKTGVVFKRARNKIKNMLRAKNAWDGNAHGKDLLDTLRANKESDLQLKSRSQFLQKRKAATRKQKHHVVNYFDNDRI